MTKTATIVYFSPCGEIKMLAKCFEDCLTFESFIVNTIDLTLPKARILNTTLSAELLIVLSPIYNDHIPQVFLQWLNQMQFDCKYAIVGVGYGAVSQGVGLTELCNVVGLKNNIKIVRATHFVTNHCYLYPHKTIDVLHDKIKEQIQQLTNTFLKNDKENLLSKLLLPTLKEHSHKIMNIIPQRLKNYAISFPYTETRLCNNCTTCQRLCPTNAISTTSTDFAKCIKCHACVKNCPTQARKMTIRPFVQKFISRHYTSKIL